MKTIKQSRQNRQGTLEEYQRRVFDAMNYISEHASDNLSLEEIAQIAHFSKFHFHRIFKVFAGETVADFTRRIRLEKAASLLYFNPDKSITDIALQYGFSSSQNFAKQFNRSFGMPPSCFREENSKPDALKRIHGKHSPGSADALHCPCVEFYRTMDVSLQPRPAFRLAYLRFIGAYETTATQDAIGQLIELLTRHHIEYSTLVGIAWDNPDITPADKCRYDIGVIVGSDVELPDALATQEIPGGHCAVYRCEVTDNDLETPWDDLVTTWLPYSGYLPSGSPGYELFHRYNTESPTDAWVMDICIPVIPL